MEGNVSTSKIKQPEPAIVTNSASKTTESSSVSKKKRSYNTPYVGVLEAPNLSTTPIMDAFCKTKEENPHTVYKITSKKHKLITPQTLMSLGILICSAILTKNGIKSISNSRVAEFIKGLIKKH